MAPGGRRALLAAIPDTDFGPARRRQAARKRSRLSTGASPCGPPYPGRKGLAALDEHQVRRYASWSRWVILAMLAHAFLAVVRADEHARHPVSDARIPLTRNEIQHLFIALVVRPALDAVHRLGRSDWRRRPQARSQTSHYRRQAAQVRRSRSTAGIVTALRAKSTQSTRSCESPRETDGQKPVRKPRGPSLRQEHLQVVCGLLR